MKTWDEVAHYITLRLIYKKFSFEQEIFYFIIVVVQCYVCFYTHCKLTRNERIAKGKDEDI